ncbi:hypothetical protein PHLGIDRAFT_125243 [Phlebiopsis gigantea 11061_1 CR5-6]|uniref:Autophagy-related protein 27 n=1 Tax=Phlebiopsis gigantea (strain 11061_1 CR5-6) TaxID=745531 RepID=A0A0C3S4X7_PHLG1|nr:hypothetical protein PHLGIDRAFT_125243 [Phlebiopsis gigantea 11061_1 CR5-6]
MLRQHMNLRALSCAFLFLAATRVSAQDAFDCKITSGEYGWDLTSLKGEHTLSQERETPPTKFRDDVTFNLCEDLTRKDGVADRDQCEAGTRACLTQTNIKESENERITAVIPLARSSVEHEVLPAPNKGIRLTFSGPSYPDPVTSVQTPQSLKVDIFCKPGADEPEDPEFKSYDGKELRIEWNAPAGCGFGASDPEHPPPGKVPDTDKGKKESSVGSGLGWFFLLFLLALAAYFGLGAYYNYSTYGASGMDLIPHRDFWREVPYMLRDVVSHLCSAVRPRSTSSRGGYIAV